MAELERAERDHAGRSTSSPTGTSGAAVDVAEPAAAAGNQATVQLLAAGAAGVIRRQPDAETAAATGATAAPLLGKKKGETKGASSPKDDPKKGKAKKGTGPWTLEEIKKLPGDKPLQVLAAIAKRDPKSGVARLKEANAWNALIGSLPDGAAIPAKSKTDLYTIIAAEAVNEDDAKKLFKKRFQHDATGAWTMANLKIVWKQLDLIPDQDVSKNTIISNFEAIAGGGGFGPSWEAPDTINAIQLGQDGEEERLPHTVRHEVGHGVHAQIPGPINSWLQNDMKMWFSGVDNAGVDAFVTELGGYPDKYTYDGAERDFDGTAKAWVQHMIRSYTGSGQWDPGRATPDEGEDPHVQAMWAAMPAAVKNACAQSVSHWYSNYRNFQKGTSGDYVFLNHWYHRWFRMSETAKKVVDATGDNYTAMSEKEFFANAYAEFFADPAGAKNPKKWGGKLPKPVQEFFRTCIVVRNPYEDFAKKQKKKLTSK